MTEEIIINQLKTDVQGFKEDIDIGIDQEFLDKQAKWILKKAKEHGLEEIVFEEMFGKDLGLMAREDEWRQEKSECCGARMIGGIQCEACGSNGKIEVEERMAEELEDERFDYHPRPEEVN